MAAGRSQRNALSFRRIWGFGGLYKRKAPKAPLFCARRGGKRPPRWGGGPAGARGGPSYLFAACGRPAGSPLSFFLLEFSGIPAGWLPLEEGFPLLGISRHPAGGVVGSRPDRRVTFLRGQESNQRNRRGPLPAPWTPGAVVPDLQPLLAFSLEPSSGLSAAWVDTRLPPPFGCWNWEGAEFGGTCSTEGGCWRIEPLRPCGPPPLSKGRLRGAGAGLSVSARQPPPLGGG